MAQILREANAGDAISRPIPMTIQCDWKYVLEKIFESPGLAFVGNGMKCWTIKCTVTYNRGANSVLPRVFIFTLAKLITCSRTDGLTSSPNPSSLRQMIAFKAYMISVLSAAGVVASIICLVRQVSPGSYHIRASYVLDLCGVGK